MDVKNGLGGDDYQNKGAVEGEELYKLSGRRINLCGEECAGAGAGRSSSVYCRKADGVPFKWEKKPGTPQLIPNEEMNIIPVVPLSPPPCLQSLELPLPCSFHHHTDSTPPHVFNSWRRKIKKMLQQQQQHAKIIIAQKSRRGGGGGGLQHKSSTHHQRQNVKVGVGDSDTDDFQFIASSSSSSSSCSNAPFCYASPWNLKAALMKMQDEEAGKKTKNNNNSSSRYYSKEPRPPHHHKASSEDGDGFSCRSRSRLSSESSRRLYYCMSTAKGIIPFQWEIQAGAPKTPGSANDLLLIPPPPTPPPLAQSLALPKPRQSQNSPSSTKLWKPSKRFMAAAARIRNKLIN